MPKIYKNSQSYSYFLNSSISGEFNIVGGKENVDLGRPNRKNFVIFSPIASCFVISYIINLSIVCPLHFCDDRIFLLSIFCFFSPAIHH